MKIHSHHNGFTLVELVIVIAIFGALFTVVSNTFVNSLKAAAKAEATKEVRQNAEVILARMSYDLKQADDITGCTGTTIIRFIEPNNTVESTYTLLADQIVRQSGAQDDQITDSQSVRVQPGTLSFTCVDPNGPGERVDILFTLEYLPFGDANLIDGAQSQDLVRIPFRTTVVNRNVD